jgi:hypothetical protein
MNPIVIRIANRAIPMSCGRSASATAEMMNAAMLRSAASRAIRPRRRPMTNTSMNRSTAITAIVKASALNPHAATKIKP